MRFHYEVALVHLPAYGDERPIETFKGDVEAKDFSEAKTKAGSLAWERCQDLKKKSGLTVGYDPSNVRVKYIADPQPLAPVMTAEQIIARLERRMHESREKAQLAEKAFSDLQGRDSRLQAMQRVREATVEYDLLQSILREINGLAMDHSSVVVLGPIPPVQPRRTRSLAERQTE